MVKAWVGQISIQAVQLPQWFFEDWSMGSGISVKISARKNQDPLELWIKLVFLPIQPSPAFLAKALSKTGAESTK